MNNYKYEMLIVKLSSKKVKSTRSILGSIHILRKQLWGRVKTALKFFWQKLIFEGFCFTTSSKVEKITRVPPCEKFC